MLRALQAEVFKLKRSRMPLWTALTVFLAPLISLSAVRVTAGVAHTTWGTFMQAGPQMIAGVYGVVLFGLVAAYLFGSEYGAGTTDGMLTLPLRREYFVLAKMVVLGVWLLGLTLLSVVVQAGYAALLGLSGLTWAGAASSLADSLVVSLLIFCTLPLVALLAMLGRGYMAPMVFSAVAAAAGVGLAEAGWSRWFPWSVPMAVTGVSLGPPLSMPHLVSGSWLLMAVTFLAGLASTVGYVDAADNIE